MKLAFSVLLLCFFGVLIAGTASSALLATATEKQHAKPKDDLFAGKVVVLGYNQGGERKGFIFKDAIVREIGHTLMLEGTSITQGVAKWYEGRRAAIPWDTVTMYILFDQAEYEASPPDIPRN